jgi:hypothetical protein
MAELLLLAGMSAASAGTAATALTGLSLVASVAGGISSYQQGEAQADQMELQARAAEVNGRMDAIATNTEMLKTLSRNNAGAAAAGLKSTGSVARANEAAQRKAAQELSVNRFNTEMEVSALNQKAESASRGSKVALVGSLFDAVNTGSGAYNKIKGT